MQDLSQGNDPESPIPRGCETDLRAMKAARDECEHARETTADKYKSLDLCMLSEFSVETGISGAPNNQIKLPCGGSCVRSDVEFASETDIGIESAFDPALRWPFRLPLTTSR